MLYTSTLPVGAVRQGQVENTLQIHCEILATVNQLITKEHLRPGIISLMALNQYWKQWERMYLMFPVILHWVFGIPDCVVVYMLQEMWIQPV